MNTARAAVRESESSEFLSDEEDSRTEDESKLSEDDLQRTLRSSWKHTLLSFIPFTKEHAALQQVIDAVDNITKLQMEVLRARKLVRTVQAGQHEVALRQLLAAVQQTDFHYFQKVRHERILSGKWLPVATTVRKRDGPRSPNRFKQALNSAPEGVDRKKSAWMVQSHAFGASGKRAGYGSKRKKRLIDDEQLPQCSWQPTPGTLQEVGFVCKNSVVRRLDTRQLTSFCAWHSRTCLMAHQDETQAAVAIPNSHGLCSMHHIAKFGHDADPPPFPLPGMVSTLQAYANPYSTHPLAPRRPPPAAVMLNATSARSNGSVVPPWEQWWRDKLNRTVYAKQRRLAATAIQNAYRMHVCVQRFRTTRFLARANVVRREKAARCIQRLVRSTQGKAFRAREYRSQFRASLLLQRWWRGTAARQYLRRDKAAMVIQRLFQLVHARRLRMDDAAVDHVEKYVRRLQAQAVRIQKVWRGSRARRFVARRRIEWVSGVVLIEAAVRKWLVRVRRRRMEARVEARRLARAANILRSFYFQYVRQDKSLPEWTREQLAKAEAVQRVVRGYLSRLKTLRLRATRDKLWNFLNPADVEALREILFPTQTAIFQRSFARSGAAEESEFHAGGTIQESSAGARVQSSILEPFLPNRYKRMDELQTVVFIRALRSLYATWDTPVSDHEISSLVRLFRSGSTGQIDVLAFTDYAQLQLAPCRRHARRICGVCIAYTSCGELACGCQHFKGRFACDECGHTRIKHRIAPLPNDPSAVSLLGTLEYQSTPDVFVTQHALLRRATLRKAMRTPASVQSPPRRSPRITSISALSLVQNSTTIGTRSPNRKRRQPYLQPVTMSLPPDIVVPREEFWSKAKLLPNASVQAYETTIASSIPVGFVQGNNLVYTMDASTVYLQILRELQAISEHISAEDSNFLRLLLRHATFFERHWRKLVRDIRLGTLNNKLALPEADKQRYLASAVAQPRMANQLDRAFRQLGFHTRMTTKEITHVTHAELRWPKAKAGRTRRHSAPELCAPVATHPYKPRTKRRMSTGSLTGQLIAELTSDQMGERGAAALLLQLESGRLRAAPIEDDGYWLCPYAGCGARFKLQHTAFLHQAMHNWKRAPQVANPHTDQFLTTFWPTDTPWQQHSTLKRFPCTVCKRVFKSPQQVTAHRRMEHSIRPATFRWQPTKWQWIGSSVLCPPFPPPTCAPLVICTIHRRSRFRCATCVLSNRRVGLQPPLRYYQQIQIRLSPEGMEDHQREFCWLSCKDEQGVVVRWPEMEDYFSTDTSDESRSKCRMSPRHCRLLALCEDKDGQAWMAVLALHNPGFTFNPMQTKVDRHCELQSGTEVRYLPVSFALSYFHLVECDVHAFHEKIREGSIPAHNSRYLVPRQPQALSPKSQAASQQQLKLL